MHTVSNKLLTIAQVAERTNLTGKAIRIRIARGQFPFTKIVKRIFVEEAELTRFLALARQLTAEAALENCTGRRGEKNFE